MTALSIVYDAVAWYSIPGQPLYLLGYVDVYDEATGKSIYQSMREQWPDAVVIPITVNGTHELTYDGKRVRMCDNEYLDLSAAGAAQWCYEELQLGAPLWAPPTPYCQAANGPALRSALKDYGLTLGGDIPWAMAWWNGDPNLLPPAGWGLPMPVYHQYLSIYKTYDMGVGLDTWLNPSPPPPPKPKPRGDDMGRIFETNGVTYDGNIVMGPAGKLVTATIILNKNALAAYTAAVQAGTQPPPIPDVDNGLYNLYVVGDFTQAEPQESDKAVDDASGRIGYPEDVPVGVASGQVEGVQPPNVFRPISAAEQASAGGSPTPPAPEGPVAG